MFPSKYYLDTSDALRADEIPSVPVPPPDTVRLPMSQHVGLPAVPAVKISDEVLRGQIIGEAAPNGLSLPVHSPISGRVKAIEVSMNSRGKSDTFVVIENDFSRKVHESVKPYDGDPEDFDAIAAFFKEKGLTGMGGSGYPVYAKLKSAKNRTETLIINATECEPFCSATTRRITESPEEMIRGALLLSRLLQPRATLLVTERRHKRLGKTLCELSRGKLELRTVTDRYPIGDERQIIRALFKKELPADTLPLAAGCAIFNAATCVEIASAMSSGLPLCEKIITVNGDCVGEKKNLLVPLGISLRDAAKSCGGFRQRPYMLICGGPMLGYSVDTADAVVAKYTSAILAFRERFRSGNEDCIHCGRCVKICPMRLMPFYFERMAKGELSEHLRNSFDPSACCECGLCTYVCPANVPLNYLIKIAKKKEAE